MGEIKDITGQRFERLTAVRPVGKNKGKGVMWECVCDCGNTIITCGSDLRRGKTRSCGCYAREKARDTCLRRNITHGMTGTRVFNIWVGMRKRCLNPKEPSYKNYGERGITICDEWLDFNNFYEWAITNGYNDSLTVDRIDVNGNYEPTNCRWATHKEQANNTRRSRFITYDGKTMTLQQWSDETGINHMTLYDRIYKSGWTVGEALEKVYRKPYRNKKRKGVSL